MNPSQPPSPLTRRAFLGQFAVTFTALTLASGLRGQTSPAPGAAPTPAAAPPAPPKKLGVALLGLGKYASGELAPALQLTKNCALTGIITGHPDKIPQWKQKYKLKDENIFSYDTMDKIKGNPDIDIIYVVTPNSLHLKYTLLAAKAGKHVVSEKPMAVSVDECDQMIKACKDAKVKLSIGYRNNFDPYFQEMMRIAKSKEFGAVTKMSGEFDNNTHEEWRAHKDLAGGGPVMDLGIYVIHAATIAADATPVAVTANEILPKTEPDLFKDVEERMHFTLEFANGATCEGFTSYSGGGYSALGQNVFHADYEKGSIDFPRAFNYSGTIATTSNGPMAVTSPGRSNNYQQVAMLDDFARCVRDNQQTGVPGEIGRRDMTIITAIYESAKNGGKRTLVKA
jgi:glucose-fructose oxidoreductase